MSLILQTGLVLSFYARAQYNLEQIVHRVTDLSALAFKVKACQDAHVVLFDHYHTDYAYEIVIGSSKNNYTNIRTKRYTTLLYMRKSFLLYKVNFEVYFTMQTIFKDKPSTYHKFLEYHITLQLVCFYRLGQTAASKKTPGILDCNEYREFWVSWLNGHIAVGYGGLVGLNQIIDYHDESPMSISYLALTTYSSGFGYFLIYTVPGKEFKIQLNYNLMMMGSV